MMREIHKNIDNFDDYRIMHLKDGIHFYYMKILCCPDVDHLPWEVDTDDDERVTCKDCLKLMETEHARS